MEAQISNETMPVYKVFLTLHFILFYWAFSFSTDTIPVAFTFGILDYPIEFDILPKHICLLIYCLAYYTLFGRFYSILIKDELLICVQLFRTKKIPLTNLISVSAGMIPYSFLSKKCYPLRIRYWDENGNKQVVRCMSKGVSWFKFGSNHIKEIDLLWSIIRSHEDSK